MPRLSMKTAARLCSGVAFALIAWSQPSGEYTIAFASFAPLNSDIFIADADGGHARPFLAHPGLDYDASFSRDGRWIVFTSERGGSADIYRAHPDGSGLERLTDDPAFDDQAALSPNGALLAFVSSRSGQANIWLLDLATRELKNLSMGARGDFRPAWSPDGEWIAFSSDRDSSLPTRRNSFETIQCTELYVIRRDGSKLRRLTHNQQSFAGSPSWSPDGTQIVFYEASFEAVSDLSDARRLRTTTQIAAIEVHSGRRRTLTRGDGEKWSPRWVNGERVGYFSGGPQGGLEFTQGAPGARGEFESPDWSSDGRQVVFHRDVETAWPPVREWHSKDPRFRLMRTGIFPSYSPGGDRLISGSETAALMRNRILLMNADGSGRSTIFQDEKKSAIAPAWSPRGDKIVFGFGGAFSGLMGLGRLVSNLAIIGVKGDGFRLLTQGDGNDGFPSWSPDGRRVVYRTTSEKGKGLRILDLETGGVKTLTEGPFNDNFPAWSPVGDVIAFTSNRDRDYEIYSIKADGTDIKRLTNSPGNEGHPAWSPDGRWIAFSTGRGGFKDESPLHPHNPQSYGELCVMRPDGSSPILLTDNPFEDATPTFRPPPKAH